LIKKTAQLDQRRLGGNSSGHVPALLGWPITPPPAFSPKGAAQIPSACSDAYKTVESASALVKGHAQILGGCDFEAMVVA
jgi:hypothetical protein